MSAVTTKVAHFRIIKNSKIQGGEPIIKGTRFPVRSVVFYILKEGILPEELVKEFPQLTLSSVYDALAYYYDYKDEIDRLIETHKICPVKKKK